MTWQFVAQFAAATLIAMTVISSLALLYARKPLYTPSRWWLGHVSNIISMAAWTTLLAIGGFWE